MGPDVDCEEVQSIIVQLAEGFGDGNGVTAKPIFVRMHNRVTWASSVRFRYHIGPGSHAYHAPKSQKDTIIIQA